MPTACTFDPAARQPLRAAFAHSVEGRATTDWEPLDRHLEEVAALAESFAHLFGDGLWGRLAGLWHDIGK